MTSFKPPTDEELRNTALTFLRTCRPKEYQELRKAGELEESLSLKVSLTKKRAANLIVSGTFENQA